MPLRAAPERRPPLGLLVDPPPRLGRNLLCVARLIFSHTPYTNPNPNPNPNNHPQLRHGLTCSPTRIWKEGKCKIARLVQRFTIAPPELHFSRCCTRDLAASRHAASSHRQFPLQRTTTGKHAPTSSYRGARRSLPSKALCN